MTALVSGEVVAADFEEGDQVQEGDVLYRVDTDSVETQISSAYKQVERAQEDYEEALADYREAASHYDSLDYVTPSGGYVRSVSVQEGSAVQEGAALVELYDDSVMQLDVPFAASVAEGISVGDAASVTVNRTMDVLTGTVAAVEDHEDAASGGAVTRTVTIEVKNPGGLSEGMTASAEVNGMPCSADGTFSAPDGTTVTADYGGKIEEVFVAEGDYLEAGDALFRFTADSVQDQLESLERTLENAENSLEDAKDSLENQQDQLADYEITAPISGQVVQKNVKAGENLNAGTSQGAMAVIYDMSALTFEMSIDETDVLDVAVGQTVQVTADALPEESYTGVVTNVSLVSSSSNGVTVYPVTVRIDEPGNLLPGMNVSADIVLEESADTLVVPVWATNWGTTPRSFPAGSNSARPLRGRWSATRRSS